MEITAISDQTVASNSNVMFTETAVASSNCSIMHRAGSGIVTMKGNTQQCRARYKVYFSGNLGVPSTGTSAATSLALSLDGEALIAATMNAPAMTAGTTTNVSTMIIIDVPRGCCAKVSVKNTSAVSVLVQNANLIVERIA